MLLQGKKKYTSAFSINQLQSHIVIIVKRMNFVILSKIIVIIVIKS